MRSIILIVLVGLLFGCSGGSPVSPLAQSDELRIQARTDSAHDPDHNRRLWAYGVIKVNEDHTRFDWVPSRSLSLHINALNLLENGPCHDCVGIKRIVPKGNGIVDIDVGLEHPFPGLLKYTGFDVKGIIMFELGENSPSFFNYGNLLQYSHSELEYKSFTLAIAGDWELLNEDGYTFRWSPAYISGRDEPVFNYVEG